MRIGGFAHVRSVLASGKHDVSIFFKCGATLLVIGWVCHILSADDRVPATLAPVPRPAATPPASRLRVEKHRYTGQAVRLSEALARRGIKCGPEMEGHIVLETDAGELLPILGDWRGRAFYQDERLRNRRVTLVANRQEGFGYLLPLMVFTYDEQNRPQFTDYWCDICSIPMYEIRPCECCQGEIRLRITPQAPPGDVPDWVNSPSRKP